MASCPSANSTDMPQLARRAGLQEMGLPYAQDPAITRHLARFLRQQASASEHDSVRRGPSGLACPTHVLFNGGVMHAPFVRERLLAVLNGWLADEGFRPVQPLSGEDLMHAVARGAAYYGRGPAGQRRAHPRRHCALLLCRHRIGDACRARNPRAGEGAGGRAVRHGRRHVRFGFRIVSSG